MLELKKNYRNTEKLSKLDVFNMNIWQLLPEKIGIHFTKLGYFALFNFQSLFLSFFKFIISFFEG